MIPELKQQPSVQKNNFTQLWREEYDILYRHALEVPADGTIVEIGLAQGGTSLLFHDASREKNIRIYSIDIAPSKIGRKNLENTSVKIIPDASSTFAKKWNMEIDGKIDLLFIDGDHRFKYVCDDYNSWLPFVKPGGKIIFHDYDPPKRGGIAHFGVEICCGTIERKNLIENISHEFKLFAGFVPIEKKFLSASDCRETFIQLGRKILSQREKIFSGSDENALEFLRKNSFELTSVEACYCLDFLLKKNFELLDTESSNQLDFRRWAEQLFGFEHVVERIFPENAENIPENISFHELSKIITAEQLRIFFLSNILCTLIDWQL